MAAPDQHELQIPIGGLAGLESLPALRIGPVDADWLIVLAPGAGAPMTSDFMSALAHDLAANGVGVIRFDFPYMANGRKAPDRASILLAAWCAVLEYVMGEQLGSGQKLVVGGKSMGGRMATLLLSGELKCKATSVIRAGVMFGYPLHRPGNAQELRDAHLPNVGVPLLFFQGDRDSLARIDLMRNVVNGLGSSAQLDVFEGANHDFKRSKKLEAELGMGRRGLIKQMADRTVQWLQDLK